MLAKPGYAVGAIVAKSGDLIDGFHVIFMRVDGASLNPADSYKSEWLGSAGGGADLTVAGDGRPVIGIYGSTDGNGGLLSLGLVQLGFTPLSDADIQRIAALPAEQQVEEVRKELMRRNPGFDGKIESRIEDGVVTEFRIVTDHVTDIAPIRLFNALQLLDLWSTKVGDAGLAYFKDCKNLRWLKLRGTQVTDSGLTHFKDYKNLMDLDVSATQVGDTGLAHLKDCQNLTDLNLAETHVTDAGLPLLKGHTNFSRLYLGDNPQVSDTGLAHLKDMLLKRLDIYNTGITDLTPLEGMPLKPIRLTPKNITKGLDILRDMKSIKTIGISWEQSWPAAEFWQRYEKGEFGVAFTDADVQRIAALPAKEQIEEVRKELMKRNPGFDGTVEHKIEDGVVTEVRIVTDHVTDIAPIRVFKRLLVLNCSGTFTNNANGLLADLTPLGRMNLAGLTHLDLSCTKVTDAGIVYFKECKDLTFLGLDSTQVTDEGLVCFKECKALTFLRLDGTKVTDTGLVNFKDCKNLAYLNLAWTNVTGTALDYFKGCKNLTWLYLESTRVSDAGLAHFKGAPVKWLGIHNTAITDLTPLQGMPLEDILLTPKNIAKGMEILRDMKSLKTIGINWGQSWPAAKFWERYDKGEFAVVPFTDADVQRIAALPAEQRIEEVRKELMRRNPGFDGKMEHKIEDGVVTEFRIVTDQVTDIAPIRVFNALRVLDLHGTYTDKPNGLLADLTALRGMNLAGLTHLGLGCTKVTDAGMVYFKDCKDLTALYLDGTKVSDKGLAHFKDCKNLASLRLDSTQVSDAGLMHFQDCKDLKYLNLSWTQVSDAGLAHFGNCKSLTDLRLNHTRVDDAGLAAFKGCTNLTCIDLSGTQVSDAGLAHFKGMPLTVLHIQDTGVTDVSSLQGMPLEEILLTPNKITKGLDMLRDMKSLKTIGVEWDQAWPAAEFWERYDKGEFKE